MPKPTKSTLNNKYRPSLSGGDIIHILTLAKSESPISSKSMDIIGKLAPFQAKIENGSKAPAYSTEEPIRTSGALEPSSNTSATPNIDPALSKEEYWEDCHKKVEVYGPSNCSLQEIEAALEHRYLNDLMSPEEVIAFERNAVVASNKAAEDLGL